MSSNHPDPWLSEICKDTQQHTYIIGKYLGKGSFGSTNIATRPGDTKNYVLKKMLVKNPQVPQSKGVALQDIHSEINALKQIAKNNCPKDLLCYQEHFIDCSDPSRIEMIIVTESFDNSITLDSFIKRTILDIPERLEEQLQELLEQKEDLEEQSESFDEEDEDETQDEDSESQKQLQKLNTRISILRDKIEENTRYTPIAHKVLLKIFYNITKAIRNLHNLGISHGDIKPENILINDNYEVQIIDFGLSCLDNCKTFGTIVYNSPEVLKGMGGTPFPVDRIMKADMFSLGVIFYRIANGSFPFGKSSSGNNAFNLHKFYTTNKIFSSYNDNRYDIDEQINNFIEKLFQPETTRPNSTEALKEIEQIIQNYNTYSQLRSPTLSPVSPLSPIKSPVSPLSPMSPTKRPGYQIRKPNRIKTDVV